MNRGTKTRATSQTQTIPEAISPATGPEEIICSPKRADYIGLAVMSTALGIFMLVSGWVTLAERKPGNVFMVVLFCLAGGFFLLGAAAMLLTLREYVRADSVGLHRKRWRGPEHFFAWEDVADYYTLSHQRTVATPNSRLGFQGTVVGSDGTRLTFSREWSHTKLLAEYIKARAINAKAHDWTMRGARPYDNWTRTFHYKTADNCIAPWFLSAFLVGGTITLTTRTYLSSLPLVPAVGWGYCIISTLLVCLLLLVPAILVSIALIPNAELRARMRQKITLTEDGLTLSENDNEVFVEWEQIAAARITPTQRKRPSVYLLETDACTIDFTPRISQSLLLLNAILYNAPRVKEWRLPEDNNVLPTPHVTASNVFVHHYQTRTNRLWIILGWSLPSAAAITTLMEWAVDVELRVLPLLMGFTAVFALPTLWAGWRYKTTRIERDVDGLTFHTAFGVRHLLWSQVIDFRQLRFDGPWIGIIDSRAGRFVIYSWISESNRLLRAIEAHLPASAMLQKEQAVMLESGLPQTSFPAIDDKPAVVSVETCSL